MKLSIITVNYRAWSHLETALDALGRDFPADWELIVVDNESIASDLAEFSARYPWVRFVANSANSGFGHGCNLGAAAAAGERLLFMNPDVVADVASIQALVEIQDRNGIGIIAPGQVSATGKPQKVFDEFPSLWNISKTVKAVLRLFQPPAKQQRRPQEDGLLDCDWVTGAVLMIRRRDFDALGGWSEDYWMYVEDADLCRRAHDAGLRVACATEIKVIHAHGGSSRLNVAIKAMTKSEVIISKHVYANHHTRGAARRMTHAMIIVLRLPALILAVPLDLITLGQIPALSVRKQMCKELLRYYAGVVRTGSWLSPRALANQIARENCEKTT